MSTETFKVVPGRNDRGEPILSVLVKRTYAIDSEGRARRCATAEELRPIDQYYDQGDPDWATVQYESELAPFKPWTDVVVIGKAYAPGSTPTQHMLVEVKVGERRKVLSIFGHRECRFRPDADPLITEPAPFEEMEIRYERAYGGRDEKTVPDVPFMYPRNFLGTGVVLRNLKEVVDGLVLPNIEDPRDLLSPERILIHEPERWHLQPLPQGLGWRHRTWYPRAALLGSYPPFIAAGTITYEEELGLLPRNYIALAKQSRLKPFEAQFNNGAAHGMIFRELKGDEPVVLQGLTPEGRLQFNLPGETPVIGLDTGKGLEQLKAQLHTVSIRSEALQFDVIWRGASVFADYAQMAKMTKLHAEVH